MAMFLLQTTVQPTEKWPRLHVISGIICPILGEGHVKILENGVDPPQSVLSKVNIMFVNKSVPL